jgi:hypothetical protein
MMDLLSNADLQHEGLHTAIGIHLSVDGAGFAPARRRHGRERGWQSAQAPAVWAGSGSSMESSPTPKSRPVVEPEPQLEQPAEAGSAAALFRAAARGDVSAVRRVLAEHGGRYAGAVDESCDGQGTTALMVSVMLGRHEVARELLRAGADPDAQDGTAWCRTEPRWLPDRTPTPPMELGLSCWLPDPH